MANRFERLWDRTVDRYSDRLRSEGIGEEEIVAAADALAHLGFPGQVALLSATNDADAALGDDLLEELASELATRPEVAELGLDAGDVEQLLRVVLLRRGGEVRLEEATKRKLLALALERLAARSRISATPRDFERAAELLLTGEFFGDVASSTAAIAHAVPRVPLAIARDVVRLPARLPRLVIGAARDLAGVPGDIRAVLEDLLDGTLDHSPRPLKHTMRALYGFATLQTIFQTLHDVLGEENATARLALVVYARAHGLHLTEADIDAFLGSVARADEPDLLPFLQRGVSALQEKHGSRWTEAVDRMGR